MSETADQLLLRRLEPDLDALLGFAGEAEAIIHSPFRVLLSRTAEWANFAEPIDAAASAGEVDAAIEVLRRLFGEHERPLRILFKERRFPGLGPMLEKAGLRVWERQPLMTCVPNDFRPLVNSDVQVRFLSAGDADADLAAYQTILSQSLGDGSWTATPEALAVFRADLERGLNRCAALATLLATLPTTFGGGPAGTGFLACSANGCELLSIATVPELRRRGVAATLTSFLMNEAFARGSTLLWLVAENAGAQALYEKLGFRQMGDELEYRE